MRVLLTGCSGNLGAATARAVVQAGHTVLALVHRRPLPASLSALEGAGIVPVQGSLESAEKLAAELDGADAVVHCAFDWRRAPAGHFEQANVDGALALFSAAVDLGARRFVQISSVMAYGLAIGPASQPVRESAPLVSPASALDRYAAVKSALEEKLAQAATAGRCSVVSVRPGLIFTDDALPEVRLVGREGGRIALLSGTGHNHLPYIHVDDVAALIVRVLAADQPEAAYNATPSQAFPTGAMARAWARGREPGARPIVVPTRTLPREGAAVVAAVARTVRGGAWRMPNLRYGRMRINRNIVYSNTRARTGLGWEDTTTAGILRGNRA